MDEVGDQNPALAVYRVLCYSAIAEVRKLTKPPTKIFISARSSHFCVLARVAG
jgi:hypothetical protein